MARLRELGTNIPLLAENGVKIFFTQVFRHNFFHADMHPGNIFVLVDDPARPRYAAVDFGIVGTLDARDQKYLAENFLAVFDRDYRRVATLHLESGWVPANTRIDEMESAIRTVCEPIFNKPLKEISFGQILLRLFAISRRFNMEIQPQLVLLQKTLLNVEGLGRQLYDELDIWKTATPILRDWMSERVSGATVIESLRTQLPEVLDAVRALPPLLKGAVQQAQDGTLRLRVEAANIDSLKQTIRDSNRRRDGITISAALLLGAIIWQAVAAQPAWAGWVLGFLGVLQLIRTWWRN
jgi:ubiquinone biosynthesis protein